MSEFPDFDRTMDTLEELIDGIAEIMEGLVVPISAPTLDNSTDQWRCDCCGVWVDADSSCPHGTMLASYDAVGRSMLQRRKRPIVHPVVQPLNERIDRLEAQVRTQKMQIDAILNSLTMTIEANDRLSTFIHSQQIQLSDVSSRFRSELTRQAVNLIQTLGIEEPTDPSPEDQFEYDEWRFGEELTYRTEQSS